jgi:hypothetical protein
MAVLNRIIREPAALVGLVTLVLAGGSIFDWWTLTQEQFQWLLALLGALILVLRQYVTPISDPNLPIGTIVNANSPQTTGIVVAQDKV